MQDLDALKMKSLSELRQIAKALGINEQLKKKELTLNKTLKLLKDIKTDLEKAVKENKNGRSIRKRNKI